MFLTYSTSKPSLCVAMWHEVGNIFRQHTAIFWLGGMGSFSREDGDLGGWYIDRLFSALRVIFNWTGCLNFDQLITIT